jgi:AcrR family transcriptional regulator
MSSADPSGRPSRRAPAGAAVLQADVTEAIRDAVFDELAGSGYGRLSMEAVARRAGVGKTAIYRRWSSKREMVVDLASRAAVSAVGLPDTGSLLGDVREFVRAATEVLSHPLAGVIIPDLLAEVARDPALGEAFAASVREPRRERAAIILERAVRRGELDAGLDVDLALDFLGGPLYWRLAVTRSPVPDGYYDRLAAMAVAAIRA